MASKKKIRRIIIFNMLAIFSILLVMEISLRVFEYGPYQYGDENQEQRGIYQSARMPDGREIYYSPGANIAQGPTIDHIVSLLEKTEGVKYQGTPFDARNVEPYVFLKNKPENVKRIFIVGGSPVWGGPGLSPLNLSTYMYNELKGVNLHREVEIINTAPHEVDIKQMAKLLREVGDYSPDLVLTYIAGVYPDVVLDTIPLKSLEQNSLLFRIEQVLSGLQVYHLCFDLINTDPLMANFDDIVSMYDKPDIFNPNARNVLLNYQRILQQMFHVMLDEFHKSILGKNIPAAFLSVVTNLADSPPFASIHTRELSQEELMRFTKNFKAGQRLFDKGNYNEALHGLEEAHAIDPTYAMNSYYLGRCRLILGDTKGAEDALKKARDFDASPERMPSEPTQALYEWCGQHRIPYIDLYPQLAAASDNGVPGNEFFRDIDHPNEAGLAVMGRAVVDWILLEKKWFARSDEQTAQNALQ